MLRFVIRRNFAKEVLDYSKQKSNNNPFSKQVNCLVLHPVFHPNKGPEMELYMAEEAVGLAKALYWSVTKGPFWKYEYTQDIRKSQGRDINKGRDSIDQIDDNDNDDTYHRKKELNNQQLKEDMLEEGWQPSNEVKLKEGEYVHIPGFSGVVQNGGLLADLSSESDDDLEHEWRNAIIRNSIAKSSLIKVKRIHSSTFFTKGKIADLGEFIRENEINAVFINHQLSPLQTRNLERVWTDIVKGNTPIFRINHNDPENSDIDSDVESDKEYIDTQIKVFDRYTMILQIFAKRSSSNAARLQIELSFLKFAKTKLVRSGNAFASLTSIFQGDLMSAKEIQLEVVSAKQKRAIGKMHGSGESALEIQRRLIDERISIIKKQLENSTKQVSKLRNRSHVIQNIPRIALIGYTNAGKSQLLNCILQKEEVESRDLLFQTLNTTQRKIRLKTGQKAIMLDTIGFISDLPHDLIEAFKSTLMEVADADIVLHIRDISNPCADQQKKVVLDVLKQLKFDSEFYQKKMIEVWNKIDLLKAPIDYTQLDESDYPIVPISALQKINIDNLLNTIENKSNVILNKKIYSLSYNIEHHFDRLKWLYDNGNITGIQNEEYLNGKKKGDPTVINYDVLLDEVTYNRYIATFEPKIREAKKRNKGMPPPDW